MREDLMDQEYLGDGVYIGHDGYHVVLWLEVNGAYGPGAIALEPPLLRRLDGYRERLASKFDAPHYRPEIAVDNS